MCCGFYRFWYLPSNGAIGIFFLWPWLTFSTSNTSNISETVRNSAKYFFDRTFKDFHTRHQMELLRKFYSATYFSRSNISNTYISSSKIRHVTFVDLNIRHRMAPLRRFMLDNLELLFSRSNISNVNIYETLRDGAKNNNNIWLREIFLFVIEWTIAKSYSANSTYILKVKIRISH